MVRALVQELASSRRSVSIACMLRDEIKQRMMKAMKAGAAVEKGILRLVLSEVQAGEARSGEDFSDEQVVKIVRKLLKSNEESLAAAQDEASKATLAQEIEILKGLVPQTLDEAQIIEALASVLDGIKAAGSDGQATGVAMKHLKSSGAAVEGKDVAAAVRAIRS